MEIETIKVVSLSALAEGEGRYEDLCSLFSPVFTWGDTDMVLVAPNTFIDTIHTLMNEPGNLEYRSLLERVLSLYDSLAYFEEGAVFHLPYVRL
jgi:hypothetical protein